MQNQKSSDSNTPNVTSKPNQKPDLLVTTALPYANGSLHLGFMVEAIQADIWVRAKRMLGHRCFFICGDDAHGTPIMLKAESLNISPEELISKLHTEHVQDLKDFYIAYDNFYTTHSPENRELAHEIYKRLNKKGDIVKRKITQAFDPVKNMFLPDRYVRGNCPKCNAADQYGDNCEVCGATYSPSDLKNPKSVISGATPIQKESEHYFFCLDHYESFLKDWVSQEHLQPEVSKKLEEWFTIGLEHWDISRDGPYFGFEIPDAPNKYFYVWLDAPIGYMASFKNFCENKKATDKEKNSANFEEFWKPDTQTQLYHFIGKDIVYFHALFWPAMLKGANFRTPTSIFVHGFLTVNGHKMSKSRGTFINTRTYLDHLKPEYLRYYFASKLNAGIEDVDFEAQDFMSRVNADLVGKLINIASRTATLLNQKFEGKLAATLDNPELYQQFVTEKDKIFENYQKREYNKAIREIMSLADLANRYIDDQKPWNLVKDPADLAKLQQAHQALSLGLNLFRVLITYLSPILPNIALQAAQFLNSSLTLDTLTQPLTNHKILAYQPLIQRIEIQQVNDMMNNTIQPESGEATAHNKHLQADPLRETIQIEDFSKVDLRIAKILNAELVPEANKLLKLSVDIGEPNPRQIFAGIKEAYEPADLIGKFTVVVANLAPRKMRFGLSEGMVLAAGPGGKELWILEPHSGAEPGMRVK